MSNPYRKRGSRFWWISPVQNGLQVPMSTGLTDYDEARQMIREIEGDIARGFPIGSKIPLFRELCEEVGLDYKIKNRSTKEDLRRRLDKHIIPALGHIRAVELRESDLARYISRRQDAKAKAATINRELAIIKRAFRLGRARVPHPPEIEMLPENNETDGFYEPEQFAELLSHCRELQRDILTVMYITGWRRTSILRLEWNQVSLNTGFVWLNANDTKNRLAVRWPLMAGLREIFERRYAITEAIEKKQGREIAAVFHRNGRPVKSIRTAFERARVKANLPARRIHDFRGTATVNLLEAGVDPIKVMGMVGFKTIQMVTRYANKRGLREKSLLEAGSLLEARLKGVTGITAETKAPNIRAVK